MLHRNFSRISIFNQLWLRREILRQALQKSKFFLYFCSLNFNKSRNSKNFINLQNIFFYFILKLINADFFGDKSPIVSGQLSDNNSDCQYQKLRRGVKYYDGSTSGVNRKILNWLKFLKNVWKKMTRTRRIRWCNRFFTMGYISNL